MVHAVSFVGVCALGVALYVTATLLRSKRSGPLPPGPVGLPVIGNFFQMSSGKQWGHFAALSKIYGDVLCMSMLGTRYVVLNSSKAISGILETQSIKCSNRPHLVVGAALVGWDKTMVLMDYNDRYRQYRKLCTRFLSSTNLAVTFYSTEQKETRRFLCSVLRNPEDLVSHIRSTAGTIILKATYGYTVQEENDPLVEGAEKAMASLAKVVEPGAYLVDVIPALRYLPEWFPGTSFLQEAKRFRQFLMEAVLRPHQYVVKQAATVGASPSFSSTLLEGGVSPEEENNIMWTTSNVYFGGSDTTASAIHAFFLAMVLYPGVQTKAQAELDAVVGCERLPTFEDQDSLPYVNAVWKEVLRWHPITPLALTHVATEDIFYEGYVVPKGSHILGNAWAVLHDESTYPDPDVFRPERFLGETPEPDPQNVCFGFGRRKCPGYHLAEASLFISVAMSLAVLNISKQVIDGVEVTPRAEFSSDMISHPKPFRCRITARSPMAEALLHG